MDTFRKWLNKPKVRLLTLNIVHSMYESVCVGMCECVTYIKTTIAPDNLIYICVCVYVCEYTPTHILVCLFMIIVVIVVFASLSWKQKNKEGNKKIKTKIDL